MRSRRAISMGAIAPGKFSFEWSTILAGRPGTSCPSCNGSSRWSVLEHRVVDVDFIDQESGLVLGPFLAEVGI